MSRSVSTSTGTEIAKTITTLHLLVKINYATPLYYCSSGDITFDSIDWSGQDIKVSGLKPDSAKGKLIIGDITGGFASLMLTTGIADVGIKVWRLYGESGWSSGDEELLFDGVGGGVSVAPKKSVTIDLLPAKNKMMFSPRVTIDVAAGFNHLPPEGQTIQWGGESYTLERNT